LPKLSVGQFEIRQRQLGRMGQGRYRNLQRLLTLGHSILKPKTPAEIQFALRNKGTLWKFFHQHLERTVCLSKVRLSDKISSGEEKVVRSRAFLKLAQPQFAKRQQPQISRIGIGGWGIGPETRSSSPAPSLILFCLIDNSLIFKMACRWREVGLPSTRFRFVICYGLVECERGFPGYLLGTQRFPLPLAGSNVLPAMVKRLVVFCSASSVLPSASWNLANQILPLPGVGRIQKTLVESPKCRLGVRVIRHCHLGPAEQEKPAKHQVPRRIGASH